MEIETEGTTLSKLLTNLVFLKFRDVKGGFREACDKAYLSYRREEDAILSRWILECFLNTKY